MFYSIRDFLQVGPTKNIYNSSDNTVKITNRPTTTLVSLWGCIFHSFKRVWTITSYLSDYSKATLMLFFSSEEDSSL